MGNGIYIDPGYAGFSPHFTVQDNIVAGSTWVDFSAPSGTLRTHDHNLYWHTGAQTANVANYGSTTYTPATITSLNRLPSSN